jgi:hypothetical protein
MVPIYGIRGVLRTFVSFATSPLSRSYVYLRVAKNLSLYSFQAEFLRIDLMALCRGLSPTDGVADVYLQHVED